MTASANVKTITLEHKAKHRPQRSDHIIRVPINRSFYLRPGERRLVFMPMKSSHDLILHPVVHPALKVSTGFQKHDQYFKLTVTNTSTDMLHVTDRMTLTCFQPDAHDTWKIAHRASTTILHFFV